MTGLNSFPKVLKFYFGITSISLGTIEFIHDYKRYSRLYPSDKSKNMVYSIPGFFTGFVLGPAFPFFYTAGCKALDYKKCPQLK